MKIMFYVQSLVAGGAQRVVAVLANHWAEGGKDVVIVTLDAPSTDFYTLDSRVRRIQLQYGARSGDGGVRATYRRVRALRKLIRVERPEVAVAMMDTANVVLALARLGIRDGIFVGSERIYPPFSGIPRHWELMRGLVYRYLDVVVAQTSTTARWLKANAWSRNIRTIPNPIALPLDRHDPIIEVDFAVGKRVLLGVGRLVPQKNMVALVEAFAAAARQSHDWILVILGEGPERARIQERVVDLQIGDRVRLVGKAGNTGDWYARADLFAMTSNFEGFPNTLLEAMAHGVAAVAFDCDSGPSDLIRPGVDGYLVPPGEVGAFGESLRKLMVDDNLRADFARRAAEVRDRYAVARIAAEWNSGFESAIETRHSRGRK
jgi:glycosyltransferase involved in cell wall biosynthesis